MDSVKTPRVIDDGENTVEVPVCMHKVKPLDHSVASEQSQLQNIVSSYEHILDTVSNQLRLLENMTSATPSQPAAPKKEAEPRTASAAGVQLKTKFSYKWPADLKYPISIAVKVNSEHIPATPWLFRRMFGSKVHLRFLRHSSFKGVLPDLVNDNAQEYKLNEVKVIFTIVVHDVQRLEFVDDPLRHGTLYAEHNLLRYLLRVLKICSPITDPIQDAISEGFVDTVGINLLQKQEAAVVKKTLGSLEGELRSKNLLVRPDQPTAADFSLFAACYEHNLKGFAGIEFFRNQLAAYLDFKNDNEQWFWRKP